MNEANPTGYPVTYDVQQQLSDRNRLTVFFRIILAIPHLLIVGGPGFIGGGAVTLWMNDDSSSSFSSLSNNGVLGLVAGVVAFIAWFAILFSGRMPRGLWDFQVMFLRWRANAIAYTALLRDEYPPFGSGEYPVAFSPGDYPEKRDRLTVFFRLLLAIPHAIVLFFLSIAWAIVIFITWLVIVFSGSYPEGLWQFNVGVLRWSLRLEAYVYLVRDEYPPFSLN